MNSRFYAEACDWYDIHANRIRGMMIEEDDGTVRPLTNVEMSHLIQLRTHEQDVLDAGGEQVSDPVALLISAAYRALLYLDAQEQREPVVRIASQLRNAIDDLQNWSV